MKLQLIKHHTLPVSGIPDDSRRNRVPNKPSLSKLVGLALAMVLTGSAHAQTPLHYDGAALLLNQIIDLQDEGIFTDVENISINRYGGSWSSKTDPSFVQWATPENNLLPMNNTKCSSLVTHLFRNLYGWDWKGFTFFDPIKNTNHSTVSPQAYQYVALIKQGKGFEQVPTLDAAETGDILGWWEVGSSSSDHTMIISSIDWESAKPYPLGHADSDPSLAGTVYYAVTVIDCSASTHTADTRLVDIDGQITHIPGIGAGVIGLLVDEDSKIIGRTWSLPNADYYTKTNTWVKSLNSRLKLTPAWEIVIGRKL
jgi:hypothetical protein